VSWLFADLPMDVRVGEKLPVLSELREGGDWPTDLLTAG